MQTITLKIGSAASGRDYATVAAAWASTPSDWVAADVSYVFELYNDSEFVPSAVWNFNGKTLDATHTLVIRPAVGHGFNDNPNVLTNALRYNQANGVAVKFAFNYATHISLGNFVTMTGLQIKSSGAGAISSVGISFGNTSAILENCLIENAGSNATLRVIFPRSGIVRNTYVILTGTTSTAVYWSTGGASPTIENVTVVRLSSLPAAGKPAFDADGSGMKVSNCAAFGCSAFSTRSDLIGSNNASDGAISFGTNNKTNLVYANQFVDTVNDFRVKAGSDLIDAGTTPSAGNTTTIGGVRQQGSSADIGAWEYPSAVQAPQATVTGISVTGQTVVVTGTTSGNPTSGTASITPAAVPYNSAVAQNSVNVVISSGTFTITFNGVQAGRYNLAFSVSNSSYSVQGSNPLGVIDVVGPRALSLIQDGVTDGQILTIHGTVENATSGSVIIPASASNPNVATQNLSVTVDTTVTPNTFTVSAALPPGSYDAPILTFTGPAGTSMPQSGTTGVVVVGPRALTVVQDPISGQVLTIHGTVEKATSGKLVVPIAATNPGGAVEQTAAVTVDTSVTPNTFTVSVTLPAGNYGVPILTFSNVVGESQPQAGTSAVSIMAISGSPEAPPQDAPATATVTGVTVSPSTATGSTTFTATVTGTNSPSQLVTWNATAGSIDINGVFTAPAATSSQQVITITATSIADGTKFGTATVTIAAAVTAVSSVSVSPSSGVLIGGLATQFTATVVGTNSPPQSVTWSTNLGTISAAGVLTAPAATSVDQTVVVTATSVFDTSKFGTATMTIAAVDTQPTVTSVDVVPASVTVTGGTSKQFSATVSGDNSPAQGVTWSVDKGTISAAGLFKAPDAIEAVQFVTVTAASVQDPRKSGTAIVTVPAAVVPTVKTATINLVRADGVAIAAGDTLKFAWFDQSAPDQFSTPTDKGTVVIGAGGLLQVSLTNTMMTSGQVGWLVVTNSDGNPSTVHKAFSGPVKVD
jgi:hypothetical protein